MTKTLQPQSDDGKPVDKRCPRCETRHPLDCFYRNSTMRDGLAGHCKECAKAAAARWKLANPERASTIQREWRSRNRPHLRAWNKKWAADNPDSVAESNRRYAEKHPDRKPIWRAVGAAVRSGLLVREVCFRCGGAETDAHHEDYSKPLDVVWLCKQCHKDRHREIRAEAKS